MQRPVYGDLFLIGMVHRPRNKGYKVAPLIATPNDLLEDFVLLSLQIQALQCWNF